MRPRYEVDKRSNDDDDNVPASTTLPPKVCFKKNLNDLSTYPTKLFTVIFISDKGNINNNIHMYLA